jgi:hypothetical protein
MRVYLATWAARGPYIPHPHGHSYSSGGSGLLSTLAHAIAWGFGSRAGAGIASLFSPGELLVIALVAIGAYLLRRRTNRRRSQR